MSTGPELSDSILKAQVAKWTFRNKRYYDMNATKEQILLYNYTSV